MLKDKESEGVPSCKIMVFLHVVVNIILAGAKECHEFYRVLLLRKRRPLV
jgi:hypothetical protein